MVCEGVHLKLLEEAELPRASMTGGLVQEFEHSVLPSISPPITFLCTLLAILVSHTILTRYCIFFVLVLTLCVQLDFAAL